MPSSLWLTILLVGVIFVQKVHPSIDFDIEQVEDVCDINTFDKCALVAQIFGHREALIPKTMEEMDKRCAIDNRITKCWKHFVTGCIKEPLTQQVVSIIFQNIKKMVNLRCFNKKYQQDLFGAVDCIDQIKDELHDHTRNFTSDLYRVSLGGEPENQVPQACCLYNTYQGKAIQVVSALCDESKLQFITEFLEGYTGEILDLMCGGYEPGSSLCNELILPELPENATLPESLMPPVLDILSAITFGKRRQ